MSDYMTPVQPKADTQRETILAQQGYTPPEYTKGEDVLTETGVPPQVSLSRAIESSPDPENFRYKVEASKYLSEMLDIEPQHVYDHFNSYVKDLAGDEMPAQRFNEYIKDVWDQSQISSEIGLRAYQMSVKGYDEETMEEIENLRKEMPGVNISDKPFFRRAAGAITNQLGLYYHAGPETGGKALVGGGVLAGVGAIAGAPLVAGPQAALTAAPYASSVGSLFALGAKLGGAAGISGHIGKVSGGHTYLELMEDGVGHNVAKWAALAGHGVEAGIEMAQVSAIPGVDEILGRSWKKVVTNGKLKSILANNAAKWATRTAEETGEEVMQAIATEVIKNASREIYENASGENVKWGDYDELLDEIKTVMIETPMSMGALSMPGTVMQTIRTIQETRGVRQQSKQSEAFQKAAEERKKTQEKRKAQREETSAMSPAQAETRMDELQQEHDRIRQRMEGGKATKADFARMMDINEEADYIRSEQVAEEETPTPAEAEIKRYTGKNAHEVTREEWLQAKQNYSKSTERRFSGTEVRQKLQQSFGWDDETTGVAEAYLGHFAKKKGMMLDEYINSRVADVQQAEETGTQFQGKRGGVELQQIEDELKGIIYVSRNGDFSTFVHELMHIEERRATQGFDSVLSQDDVETLHGWARSLTEDPDYEKVRQGTWTEDTFIAEKTAQAAENYLRHGEAPNSKLAEIFRRIAQLISDVYSRLRFNLPDINEDVKAVFDNLYSDNTSGISRAQREGRQQAREAQAEPQQQEGILYQEGIEYDEHYEAVRRAVEKGRYVPERVLQDYIGEPWADAEIASRQSLTNQAHGYDNREDFIVEAKANDPQNRPSSYYEQIYIRAEQLGADEAEANRRWLEALDNETLTAYLYEIAQLEDVQNIPGKWVEIAEDVKNRGELTESAYEELYKEVSSDPTYYRGLLHSYLGEDNQIVKNTLRSMWESEAETDLPAGRPEAQPAYSEELQQAVREAESEQDFVDFYRTMGEGEFSETQLRQIYKDITEQPTDRTQSNQEFLDSLDEATLTGYLAAAAQEGITEGFDPIVAKVARRAMKQNDIGNAYEQVMRKIRDDVFSYREAFAIATQDEQALARIEQERQQEATEERLRKEARELRGKVSTLESNYESLNRQIEKDARYEKDLRNRIQQLEEDIEEADRQAREAEGEAQQAQKRAEKAEREGRKLYGKERIRYLLEKRDKRERLRDQRTQLIREKQRKVKEVRDFYKRKIEMEKMIRRIQKKPTASIAWDYQQEIRKIQNRYFKDRQAKKRREDVLRDRVQYQQEKEQREEAQRELEAILQRDILMQLPFEQLQSLDQQIKELKRQGREIRTQQINAENEFVNSIKRQIRMQMRGVMVDEETRKWAEEQLPQELYGKDNLDSYSAEQLVALDERLRELRARGLKQTAATFGVEKDTIRDFQRKLQAKMSGQTAIEQRRAKGSKQERQRVKTGTWRNVQLNWYTPERVSELLDGGEQRIFHKLMTEDVNAMYDEYLRQFKRRTEPVLQYMKDNHITQWTLNKKIAVIPGREYTRQEVIGFYIQLQNQKSREALLYGDNLTQQEVDNAVDQLTDEEKQLADLMLEDMNNDENYNRLLKVLIEDRNEGMERVENYFTMIRQTPGFSRLDEQVQDDLLISSGKGYPRVRSGWKNTRKNIPQEFQIPIRHDAFNVWASQVMAQEKYINYQMHIKRMSRIFVTDREISEMLRQTHGEKANEILKNYLNDLSSSNIYRDTTENVINYLRRNMGMAYLGLNATTPPKQIVSLAYAMGKSSPIDILMSAGRFASNPLRFVREMKKQDIQYEFRTMETLIEELKQNEGKRFQNYQHYMQKIGFAGIRLFDRVAYGIGEDAVFNAQKRKLMRENPEMSEDTAVEQAKKIAQEEMARTQPSANVQNLPEAYRRAKEKEINKLALMFSNQLNKMFNIVTWDIPNSVRQKQYLQAIGYMAGMMAGAIAMGVISRKRWPEKWTEVGGDMFTQLALTVPFIGREIVTAWDGWGTGLEIVPAIPEAVSGVKRIADPDSEWEDQANAVIDIMLESMTLVGAPQVQLNRVMKTFMDEDFNAQFEPWELLGANEREEE